MAPSSRYARQCGVGFGVPPLLAHPLPSRNAQYTGAVPSALRDALPSLLDAECAAIVAAAKATLVWTVPNGEGAGGGEGGVTLASLGVPPESVAHVPQGEQRGEREGG